MRWQPINTAPKDGTAILACRQDYGKRQDLGAHPRAVRWGSFYGSGAQTWRDRDGRKYEAGFLTHWMPLPPPPEEES